MATNSIALFIDLENVVTSLWNLHKQSPDLFGWLQKARRYGALAFGRAYGDFSQSNLARLESDLRALGIDKFDCPVKTNGQSTVDSNIVMDLYEVALDQPSVRTFILMAGDSDYIRVVAKLRQRMDKEIIIMGVPGSVSRDLVRAAGREDPLDPSPAVNVDEGRLIRLIDQYESSRKPGIFPTFRYLAQYLSDDRNREVIAARFVEKKLSELIESGVLSRAQVTGRDGLEFVTTRLNRENPTVIDALSWSR